MTIIDRYMLRQFVQNFIVCFVSLTGVYVIFDAFGNLNAFLGLAGGADLLKVMVTYYGFQSLFFFDRTSSLLVLMSAMFTVAWIQRHHEMTALMAAGVSRIRIVAPVLIAAVAITFLATFNREVVIPHFKEEIGKRPGQLGSNVIEELLPQYDNGTGVLICGHNLLLDKQMIELPKFLMPSSAVRESPLAAYGKTWTARQACYQPADRRHPAGYLLVDVSEPKSLAARPSLLLGGRPIMMTPHDHPDWIKPNEAFMVSEVTIDALTPQMTLRQFASVFELIRGIWSGAIYASPDTWVMVHSRIVQPLLDITLLFLGLPLVVTKDNRNVFVAIGMCMGVVALFVIVSIACQKLGAGLLIRPSSLAAWAPLMIFVPAAVGMSSAMWER